MNNYNNNKYTNTYAETSASETLNNSNDVVDTDNIADGAVTTAKIANGAITEIKIADTAISKSKLSTDLKKDFDNKVDNNQLFIASKNLLKLPNRTISDNGITVNILDNIITVTGTTTAQVKIDIDLTDNIELPADNYTLSVAKMAKEKADTCVFALTKNVHEIIQDSDNTYITFPVITTSSKTSFNINDETITGIKIIVFEKRDVNVSFAIQLEAGEEATVYNSPESSFGGDLSRNVDTVMNNMIYVDSFGAVGDGKFDDTKAIKLALAAAAESKKKLVFSSGKTYIVNSTLEINDYLMDIDFNNCVIKASSGFYIQSSPADAPLIYINDDNAPSGTGYNPNSEYTKHFRNVTLDGNLGSCPTAIRVKHCTKGLFENINIRDFEIFGIFIYNGEENGVTLSPGSENVFRNIHLTNSRVDRYIGTKTETLETENSETETTTTPYSVINGIKYNSYTKYASTAIFAACSDSYFDKVVAIDWENAFVNWGADNYYTNCHVWAAFNENIIDHTVGMLCLAGNIHMNGCCFDSLRYCVYVGGSGKVWLSQMYTCWSYVYTNKTDSDAIPYVFYFTTGNNPVTNQNETTSTYLGDAINVSNSSFKTIGESSNTSDTESDSTRKVKFTNIVNTNKLITVDNEITVDYDNLLYKHYVASNLFTNGSFNLTIPKAYENYVEAATAKYSTIGSVCYLTVWAKMKECTTDSKIQLVGLPDNLLSTEATSVYGSLGSNSGKSCVVALYNSDPKIYLYRGTGGSYSQDEIIMGTVVYSIG